MFSYLITFHMNNGHTYKTVLLGKSLEDIKGKLYEAFQKNDGFPHFTTKDNKNIQFTIIFRNISAIEMELLCAEDILSFEKLTSLNSDDLSLVLSRVTNDFIIGISLLHSESSFIYQINSCLPEERKQIVADIIKLELGKIKMNDVLQAQNEIIQVVENLYEQGKIHIDTKDDMQ